MRNTACFDTMMVIEYAERVCPSLDLFRASSIGKVKSSGFRLLAGLAVRRIRTAERGRMKRIGHTGHAVQKGQRLTPSELEANSERQRSEKLSKP
jgi:hypothetical protein